MGRPRPRATCPCTAVSFWDPLSSLSLEKKLPGEIFAPPQPSAPFQPQNPSHKATCVQGGGWGKLLPPKFHLSNISLADDSSTKVDVKEPYETEASTV